MASTPKAAMVLGLGASAVIAIRADQNSRMDVEDLRHKITKSLDCGQEPFCVVATAGTTVTGNIDPLAAIAAVAREHGLWFHTDAIYGGALAFSERHEHKLQGIELSDSVTFNLHKWAYQGLTASMVLFQDLAHLEGNFRIRAPYMNDAAMAANLGELSLQGSRQADVISILLSLQHLGYAGYGRLIDSRMELARYCRTRLEADGRVEFMGESDTNIMCFRPTAAPGDSEDADARTAQSSTARAPTSTDRTRAVKAAYGKVFRALISRGASLRQGQQASLWICTVNIPNPRANVMGGLAFRRQTLHCFRNVFSP